MTAGTLVVPTFTYSFNREHAGGSSQVVVVDKRDRGSLP